MWGILSLLPDSVSEWLFVVALAACVGLTAWICGADYGRSKQLVETMQVQAELAAAQSALDQCRKRGTGLSEALEASQRNGEALQQRLFDVDKLADLPAEIDKVSNTLPTTPHAPKAHHDTRLTEALNAF